MPTDIAADRCYDQAVAPHPPMSKEQLKAFLERLQADNGLQDKINASTKPEEVLAIAKEAGFSFDIESIHAAISDFELEGATGGSVYSNRGGCGGSTWAPFVAGGC